ncbi:hypothetical protein QYM36_016685 [Artemia franciscana]|uniref:Uncharacterized protein n=1 Tax=Artemia franciscana TaxID=6661 RepID=A0AA88HFB6_ARTSF|nr:hypothetical protein QYM36_016685 [Artemia franciscana]
MFVFGSSKQKPGLEVTGSRSADVYGYYNDNGKIILLQRSDVASDGCNSGNNELLHILALLALSLLAIYLLLIVVNTQDEDNGDAGNGDNENQGVGNNILRRMKRSIDLQKKDTKRGRIENLLYFFVLFVFKTRLGSFRNLFLKKENRNYFVPPVDCVLRLAALE